MLARHTRPAGGRWPHNWNWIVFRIRDFSTIGNSINWFLPGPMELRPSAHTLTHIYILCKTNRNFRNSANSQPNTIQLHPHCDNILLSKAILSCASVFKWNFKFCWHWRLISGNCKFLFWNYFNFLARSLTKHNCWHKCLIVCFSNIFHNYPTCSKLKILIKISVNIVNNEFSEDIHGPGEYVSWKCWDNAVSTPRSFLNPSDGGGGCSQHQ